MHERKRPGPKPKVDDSRLLKHIEEIIYTSLRSPGVVKVHTLLRRDGIIASLRRVNVLMRNAQLLAPVRNTLTIQLNKFIKRNRRNTNPRKRIFKNLPQDWFSDILS